jgi:hypothetical protein
MKDSSLELVTAATKFPILFCAFTCCIINVEAKVQVIVDVVITNTATIIKFLFLVCSIVSPLK